MSSRKLTSLRLDIGVINWFELNGANLNGTLNKVARNLVQRCQSDEKFAAKVRRAGKDMYYYIDC